MCNHLLVIRWDDLRERLNRQYDADYEYLEKNYDEQNKLLPHVMKYNDLQREARVRGDRAARIITLLGAEKFADQSDEVTKRAGKKGIYFDVDSIPLWQLMVAIVEQVQEIQVVNLQDALRHFGNKASRQAIESALSSHKEIFETKVRNREKFVSLKR